MTKTLIIGLRSNLSVQLSKKIKNSELISSEDILYKDNLFKSFKNKSIKIIVNAFYPASMLNNYKNPLEYIEKSVFILAKLLEQIKEKNIKVDKIIYTSSASVYGNNNYCLESDNLNPLSLHSSLKISSEKLLESFCKEFNIPYTIARVFNMYGGNDNFSVISKLIQSIELENNVSLINGGSAIRDFIHIEDVVSSYEKFLDSKESEIVNVASGKGISIKSILDYLEINGFSINILNKNRDEIKISTANVSKLNKYLDTTLFQDVLVFVENQLKKRA